MKPKILYRADGAEFHLQPNGTYEMSDSMMEPKYKYPLSALESEFFSPTLEEALEKEKHREIGFRWQRICYGYPDGGIIILQKWDTETKTWVEVPTVTIKG